MWSAVSRGFFLAAFVAAATGVGCDLAHSLTGPGNTDTPAPTPPPAPIPTRLTFVASGVPSWSFPVSVYVDGRSVGQITSAAPQNPAPCGGGGYQVTVEASPGAHGFFALGPSRCAWQDTVTAVANQCTAVPLWCSLPAPDSSALSSFGVFRAYSDGGLDISIRDYECEDGDRVTVTLNGQVVFSNEEIFNSWKTRRFRASPGLNDITLRADNGSGFKGKCSYADANTGEIRVTGSDRGKTTQWSLRGGAGTVGRLAVVQ